MNKKLIVGLMLLAIGYAASQVMSQSPTAKRPAIANSGAGQGAAEFRESFNDEIQRIREKLADNLKIQDVPSPQDVALLKALDKYIAGDKLGKIIMELDEFAKQSPDTDEAKKAIVAIQILKAEPGTPLYYPTPDPNFNRSVPVYEPVRSRTRNGEDDFDGDRGR